MKNTLNITIILTGLLLFSLITPTATLAWDDCPKGKVNYTYPGDCTRYIDTDGNGICDHSEPAPEDRVENINDTSGESVKTTNEEGVDNIESAQAQTSSSEKNGSFSKPLLAVLIVIVNLSGILLYAKYRKSKSS